jgi:protein-S-isoprenylcysteine O-methyltransferase Ste14
LTGPPSPALRPHPVPQSLSPLPQPRKQHKLVQTGMYSYVRHPMYAGLLMASLGLSAITNNECRLALSLLLWWVLEQKVALEERALLELYPGEYAEYRQRVKKFLPYLY